MDSTKRPQNGGEVDKKALYRREYFLCLQKAQRYTKVDNKCI